MGGIGHCLPRWLTVFCFARGALFLASAAGLLIVTLEFGRGTGLARLRHPPCCLSVLSLPPNAIVSAVTTMRGCVSFQEVPDWEIKWSDMNLMEP